MPKTKTKKIRDHAADLSARVGPTVESARDKAAPMLADARQKAAPYVAEARDKAAPYVAEARVKAAPYVADARERTAPALNEARDRLTKDVLPVLTAAIAAASEATEDVRDETSKRGRAAVAALKGEVEAPKQKHRLRSLLIVLGLGGIVAAVVKKLSDREPTTAWQSSYTPTPAATPAASSTPTDSGGAHRADADDQGGASPDVAAADAAAEPHPATTPDNPAETIDVSKN